VRLNSLSSHAKKILNCDIYILIKLNFFVYKITIPLWGLLFGTPYIMTMIVDHVVKHENIKFYISFIFHFLSREKQEILDSVVSKVLSDEKVQEE